MPNMRGLLAGLMLVLLAVMPALCQESVAGARLDAAAREFAVIQLRADICDGARSATCHILHYPRKFDGFTDEFL